jgi:glycosyltransferase involved in cell wall biosynthesis
MDKITFCIPSKDNLRYLKTCIPSIRKNAYRDDHDIIVFVDQDNDGTVDWLKENADKYKVDILLNPNLNKSRFGIGKAYDKCIEMAATDIVMIFHADMMLGKHADYYAWKLLKEQTVVCSTRVEPPLHPNAGEKILRDFGMWPEEFKEEAFDNFVEGELQSDKVTEGIFAPWMIYKNDFTSIGGHDPILKSCREDSDLFNRMLLAGFTFKQPWNSLVYHLTGRGAGSFSGDEQRHKEWQQEMNNSTKEFIRKWGSNVLHEPLMKPIVAPKYNIGLIVVNCNEKLIEILEPWCDILRVDCDFTNYIKEEQSNTAYNLADRVVKYQNDYKSTDIFITVDGKKFSNEDFQYIQQMSQIIKESASEGEVYQLGNLTVKVVKKKEYQQNLINV